MAKNIQSVEPNIADLIKRLAKDKLEHAIFDHEYAKGSYEAEMSQEALLNEANVKIQNAHLRRSINEKN